MPQKDRICVSCKLQPKISVEAKTKRRRLSYKKSHSMHNTLKGVLASGSFSVFECVY